LSKGCELDCLNFTLGTSTNGLINTCCTQANCNPQTITLPIVTAPPVTVATTAPAQSLLCYQCTNCSISITGLQIPCPADAAYNCFVNFYFCIFKTFIKSHRRFQRNSRNFYKFPKGYKDFKGFPLFLCSISRQLYLVPET